MTNFFTNYTLYPALATFTCFMGQYHGNNHFRQNNFICLMIVVWSLPKIVWSSDTVGFRRWGFGGRLRVRSHYVRKKIIIILSNLMETLDKNLNQCQIIIMISNWKSNTWQVQPQYLKSTFPCYKITNKHQINVH